MKKPKDDFNKLTIDVVREIYKIELDKVRQQNLSIIKERYVKEYFKRYKHRNNCKKWDKGIVCIECGFGLGKMYEDIFYEDFNDIFSKYRIINMRKRK